MSDSESAPDQRLTPGTNDMEAWVRHYGITEVECLVPDMAGIPRGKILPADKFLRGYFDDTHRIPESVFSQTVTGDYPSINADILDPADIDVLMRPDPASVRLVPWYPEPTAQVICDCAYPSGRPVAIAPRQVLKRVVSLFRQRGWEPVVAPEVEFFLVKTNADPDYPLEPPVGRSGRPETGRQSFGIDAVNEFDPLFEDVYDYCDAQGIDVDTLNHEAGAAQMEINFRHGDPVELADQVFLFKRTLRQTAVRHNVYATFMAKPLQHEPGSAMHIHQSIMAEGRSIFTDPEGSDTDAFRAYIAGLQRYTKGVLPLIAPNVNSFRRLSPYVQDTSVNVQWGRENRTCGLRVPQSAPEDRRIEYRLPGADANPYLAIAASLIAGYLGMVHALTPTEPVTGSAYKLPNDMPAHILDALRHLEATPELSESLGEAFVRMLIAVKSEEYDTYQRVISSWEREFLLLNV